MNPRRLRRDRGAAVVEFALVLPFFLVLIGFLLWGALYTTYTALAEHAALATEHAAILRQLDGAFLNCPTFDPTSSACKTLQNTASAADLGLLPPPSVTAVQTTQGNQPAPGDVVTVTVSYASLPGLDAVRPFLSFLPGVAPDSVAHAASGRLE